MTFAFSALRGVALLAIDAAIAGQIVTGLVDAGVVRISRSRIGQGGRGDAPAGPRSARVS